VRGSRNGRHDGKLPDSSVGDGTHAAGEKVASQHREV
jgi:hypothetical protein